ncbi:MAG: thioredoxin [Saprospiraceae bacterium]|nr:thioredoxin [Saprospiraceae bacterium]
METEDLVLVDFFAIWCGPCKMMTPILDELKSLIGEKAKIIKIDVNKNQEVLANYQIQGVPTLILFKKGKIVWRQSGIVPAKTLQSIIQQYQ